MPVTPTQKNEIENIITTILSATAPRNKRRLADMFLELVDRESWPEYYEVIPEPRCLNGVKAMLEKNKYKDPLDVYNDLSLVFLNALYYNEEDSQIAKDASALKGTLDSEWKLRPVLPSPRVSPPASSAQKVNNKVSSSSKPAPAPAKKQAHLKAASAAPVPTSTPMPAPALAPAGAPAPAPEASERHPSPDMDVDVGGTPEPEGPTSEQAADGESEEIIKQLEKGLPRWEGFDESGWSEHIASDKFLDIVLAVSGYKDANGTRLAASLDALPEESAIPELSFNFPLSLTLIESRTRMKYYASAKAFDKEMAQLFLKGRRWYELGSEAYGNVVVLQRLYHALTSSHPPSPPYTTSTNFASIRAGPGTARPLHSTDNEGVQGVTTFRVSTKDRTFVDEVHFKGWSVRLADWLHLSNPDDPSKPIVAQVFKCFVSDEPAKRGQPGVTVCWYYLPEQTFHPAHRHFWEHEVFKTSHFADHPLEDILEKIACQFTARHIRGRPRPPFWFPGWPIYVCDSRYNDRERIFVKIKNWNSCVPEEVRKSTSFMPIYPFERPVFPRRFASPFVRTPPAATGPGGIGDVIERADGERIEGGGTGRRRPKRNAAGAPVVMPSRSEQTDRAGPSKGVFVAQQGVAPPPPPPHAQAYARASNDRSILAAAGGAAAVGGSAATEKLPAETARHFDRDPVTNEVLWFAAPPLDMPHAPAPHHSLAYLHYLAKKNKSGGGAGADGSGAEGPPARKRRRTQPMSVTETVQSSMMTKFRVSLPKE